MSNILLTFGCLSLVLGLAPFSLPKYEPVKKELRVHQVVHEKCTKGVCSVIDKEY